MANISPTSRHCLNIGYADCVKHGKTAFYYYLVVTRRKISLASSLGLLIRLCLSILYYYLIPKHVIFLFFADVHFASDPPPPCPQLSAFAQTPPIPPPCGRPLWTTPITSTNATLIAHIYYYERPVNGNSSMETLAGNIIADITDHLPNFLVIRNKSKGKVGKMNRPMIRLFTTKNKNNFKNYIAVTNWGHVL